MSRRPGRADQADPLGRDSGNRGGCPRMARWNGRRRRRRAGGQVLEELPPPRRPEPAEEERDYFERLLKRD